jgi:hypothetical protein
MKNIIIDNQSLWGCAILSFALAFLFFVIAFIVLLAASTV